MIRHVSKLASVAACVVTLTACESGPPTRYELAEEAAKDAQRIVNLVNGVQALNRTVRMLPHQFAPNNQDLFFLPSMLVDFLLEHPRPDLLAFLLTEAGTQPAYSESMPDGWRDALAEVRDLDATVVFKVLPRTCDGIEKTDGCVEGTLTGAGDIEFGKDSLLVRYYQEVTPAQGILRQEKTFAQRYISSQMFRSQETYVIGQRELAYLNQMFDAVKVKFQQAGMAAVKPIQLAPPEEHDSVATLAAYAPPRDAKIRLSPGLVRAFFTQCAASAIRANDLLKAWDRCPENDPRRSYLTGLKYDPFPLPQKQENSAYNRADSRVLACRLTEGTDASTMQRLVEGFSECMQEATSFVFAHELAHVQLEHGYTTLAQEIQADQLAVQMLGPESSKGVAGSSLLFQAIAQNAGEHWGVADQSISDLKARMKLLGLDPQ